MKKLTFSVLIPISILSSPLTQDDRLSHLEMELENTKSEINSRFNELELDLSSMETNFEALKEDVKNKLDTKVKREERGKFVTEAAFDSLSRKLEKLENLPRNLTDAVSRTFADMSQDLSKTTITKNEFARFQLVVARDTSHIRYQEGEWITFQQRGQFGNPKNYFARNMAEYIHGFGDPNQEFWLGLDKLVSLTKEKTQLLIEIETFEGKKIHASYSSFKVVGSDYRIHVSGYSGNAGDPLRIDNGMAFSAKDNDKDLWEGDCSNMRGGGGWWYNGCGLANLNGLNLGTSEKSYEGILWYFYANDNRCFKSTKMLLKKAF